MWGSLIEFKKVTHFLPFLSHRFVSATYRSVEKQSLAVVHANMQKRPQYNSCN